MEEFWFWITGGAIPFFLIAAGLFFFLYLRGLPLVKPLRMAKALGNGSKSEGVSPFRAVSLALAGTLGVGNIVGVADAILVGGPGAVFWMWISALFAMLVKYAEILLALHHRRRDGDGSLHGGTCYVLSDVGKAMRKPKLGQAFAVIFAGLMLLNSISMGCVIQVNAIGSACKTAIGMPSIVTGLFLLAFSLPFLGKKSAGLSRVTGVLIPILSGGYLFLSVAVLWIKRASVLPAFALIFSGAFSEAAIGGGVIGFFTSNVVRVGVMRGILSNEAGCGTAPTAHASSSNPSPASQGVWGIFEVFADTILLCTATALVILVGWQDGSTNLLPMELALASFDSALGKSASLFLTVAVFFFGFATLLCQSHYATESIRFLTSKKRTERLFLTLYALCIPIGTVLAPSFIWTLSDVTISAMTSINLVGLLLSRREIKQETTGYFSRSNR